MEMNYLSHMAKYNRNFFDTQELKFRAGQFARVHQWIEEHNASGKSWVAAHNQFSDWSAAEYKSILGRVGRALEGATYTVFDETDQLEVDWVTAGAVTGVKDQGQCGSCWAFSSTGALEGAHFVATGELLSFSEQQLVDCANAGSGYLNFGCNGGLQNRAFNYYENHAAELESVYPYTSGAGDDSTSCLFSATSATAVDVSGYDYVTPDSQSQMKAALAQQPLAVSIEADKMVFQFYSSGVLSGSACGTNLDHAVLAVGYGTDADSGLDYWLVKNSWNTTWGDQGYIKLAMDESTGTCGVQMEPLFPTTN